MSRLAFLAAGAAFGFCLSRGRVTDYDAIAGMFLLRDLHLYGVIGVAVACAAVGIALLRRSGRGAAFRAKPFHRGVAVGGLVLGVGWGLSGACPGTALAQIGEGKLYALATVAGILAGTWLRLRTSTSTEPGSTANSPRQVATRT